MMAGVLFVACIPTKEYEKELNPILNVEKKANKPNVKIRQGNDIALDVDCEQVSLLGDVEDRVETPPDKYHPDHYPPGKGAKAEDETRRTEHTTPSKGDKPSEEGKKTKLEIHPDSSMEEILICVLKSLKIENYSWLPVKNEKSIHVVFSVPEGPSFEETLHALTKWGIGVRCKSSLGVVPCALYFKSGDSEADDDDDSKLKGKDSSKSGWNEFVLSVVRSRLAVAQVVESVKGSAKLTFDYVCLIILAGTIAAVGLIENSVVSIVASMLISPLMGPILAGTFGTVIHDRKLQLMGVRNELFGLALTILVGFVIGLIIGNFDEYKVNGQWPTQEMLSRGLLRSLWVGVLIALPSGAGVALGLLGDNSGSLIGVAISASLLPPAVNAGLLWALAVLSSVFNRTTDETFPRITEKIYSDHPPSEYALLGCVSLSLTLVNIICIFIAGIVVLKIKEVAPRALTDDVQQFWHHDIKVARDYNRSLNKEDARQFEKQLAQELAALSDDRDQNLTISPGDDYMAIRRRVSSLYHFSPDTLRRISIGPRRLSQATWSPSPSNSMDTPRRSSLRDLEKLYASLGGSEPPRLSVSGPWKVGAPPLRRGKQSEDLSGLSPIIENQDNVEEAEEGKGRRSSFLPLRRNQRGHRFTVIPAASDPLKNNV